MPDRRKYALDYRPATYWIDDGASPCEPDEVVIVCITLASVWSDMICIRARRWGTRIAYRIEDEYGTVFRFKPRQSTQPLTMGELISLIDSATGHLDNARGLTGAYRDYNLDGCDAADLVGFVTVSSVFYRELQAWYAEEAQAWLASVAKGSGRDDGK